MGAEQSQPQIYKDGLDEVDTKINWKQGLIVDVRGQQPLVVVEIKPLQAGLAAGTLRIEERLDGTAFVYTYTGTRIVADHAPVYEIILKPVGAGKIGGGSRKNSKRTAAPAKKVEEISFDDLPNLTRPTKFTVRTCSCGAFNKGKSVDGKPPAIPSDKYPVEHPDDNIADDEE